jgi:putative FmdB family regulatory protein
MPTYRYRCEQCGDELDVWQSFEEKALTRHNGECGGKLVRVLTPISVVLKGPGFYKTDSRSNGKRTAAESGKDPSSASSNGDTKSDGSSNGSTSTDSKSSTSSTKKDSAAPSSS